MRKPPFFGPSCDFPCILGPNAAFLGPIVPFFGDRKAPPRLAGCCRGVGWHPSEVVRNRPFPFTPTYPVSEYRQESARKIPILTLFEQVRQVGVGNWRVAVGVVAIGADRVPHLDSRPPQATPTGKLARVSPCALTTGVGTG